MLAWKELFSKVKVDNSRGYSTWVALLNRDAHWVNGVG